MVELNEQFIELNRTFYPLSSATQQYLDTDDQNINDLYDLKSGKAFDWNHLLSEHRVILLSEAGAGKTEEIRQSTIKLRSEGKSAFFLRIEHIFYGFEDSFEEGDFDEFQSWLDSNNDGWILLDSVDEARLKDPKDFERAIKTLAKHLLPAMQRVHIIITGRVNAWRSKTDLSLCRKFFPYKTPQENDEEEIISEDENEDLETQYSESESKNKIQEFRVYSLTDLTKDQIKVFVSVKGMKDTSKFLSDIERADAWTYTTRPQDLQEILEFWNKNNRIGTRLELMQHSIERRLNERDQDRADIQSITYDQAREGAKHIAAASTFMHESTINVPDGGNQNQGLNIKKVLSDWDDKACMTLLGRPIFDEAIYGSVRFHHRSVREFLSAEWLSDLLKKDMHRGMIEELFFRKQYGLHVISPSLKPILSWLVLFDEKIRKKVSEIEPEIIIEGGDPSSLPLNTRSNILKSVCKKIASHTFSHSVTDYSSVQRFANADMADVIKPLLVRYKSNREITSFLCRMVWQGRISKALPEVKSFAIDENVNKYTRIAAIRALKEIGGEQDLHDIKQSFLIETNPLDRKLLSEIIEILDSSKNSINWVFDALVKIKDKEKYSVDDLNYAMMNFAEHLHIDLLEHFITLSAKLLDKKPLIEHRFCKISEQYGWIINSCAKAIERLIKLKHPSALNTDVLSVLNKIPAFQHYRDFECKSVDLNLPDLIKKWDELNYALFWDDVQNTRNTLNIKSKNSVTDWWQVGAMGSYWGFDNKDFELIKSDILNRTLLDDKLVALSLAFQIYKENGQPREWREQLIALVSAERDLNEMLDTYLNPPPQTEEQKELQEQHTSWERKDKLRLEKKLEQDEKDKEWLSDNCEKLNDQKLASSGKISNAQNYLLQRMRKENDNQSRWTTGNWQVLIPEYGVNVANSFHEGLINFWRNYTPTLRSEKDDGNSIANAVIFGLAGIEAESNEVESWPNSLTDDDAKLICRYAFKELNGFPNWFPKFYKKFPMVVEYFILNEIEWELKTEVNEDDKNYILSRVSWNGQWLWDGIARKLFIKLQSISVSRKNLIYMLNIIHNSNVISNEELAVLASNNCKTINNSDLLPNWFATWISVDPKKAIDNLSSHLKGINDKEIAGDLAMNVIVTLVGDRNSNASLRDVYKTPGCLQMLYLLMHEYIKANEDINRSGGGVYSPSLRDDAQDARDRLISMLKEIPGKETFLSLIKISKKHPIKSSRSWMKRMATERAEADADIKSWGYSDLHKFISKFNPHEGYIMKSTLAYREKLLGYIFGCVIIVALLVITILIPNPTDTQYATFKTILALASAGIGGVLTGFIHVEGKMEQFSIRAGGALALFVLVFFFLPAQP